MEWILIIVVAILIVLVVRNRYLSKHDRHQLNDTDNNVTERKNNNAQEKLDSSVNCAEKNEQTVEDQVVDLPAAGGTVQLSWQASRLAPIYR